MSEFRTALINELHTFRRGDYHIDGCSGCPRMVDVLLPVVAAHEAETVASILDRIDALHAPAERRVYTDDLCADQECEGHDDPISGANYCPSYITTICRVCTVDDGWDRDLVGFPCPTRRLTELIREELNNA